MSCTRRAAPSITFLHRLLESHKTTESVSVGPRLKHLQKIRTVAENVGSPKASLIT